MTPSEDITPFLIPVQALQSLLDHFEGRGVIIGGIAASLLGTPRFTADLDAVILIDLSEISDLITYAAKLEIYPRIVNSAEFAQKNRVLLMRHAPSGIDIDLSLGALLFEEEMVKRSRQMKIGGINLRLPTPEDMIIMKAVAHRPKDLMDIQAIASSNQNLDRDRIRLWVEQFGEALDLPGLWEEIESLL